MKIAMPIGDIIQIYDTDTTKSEYLMRMENEYQAKELSKRLNECIFWKK